MKKQVKVLLLIAMICVLAFATMLVSSAALDAEQGDNAWQVKTGETSKGYAATLADAIAEAAAGDTIYLLKNTTENAVTVDKALTIKGNGNTVTFNATGDLNVPSVAFSANLTVDDLKINAAGQHLFANTATGVTFVANDVVVTAAGRFFRAIESTRVVDVEGTPTEQTYALGGVSILITGSKTNISVSNHYIWFPNNTDNDVDIEIYLGSGENKGTMTSGTSDSFRFCSKVAFAFHGGNLKMNGDAIYTGTGMRSLKIDGDTAIYTTSRVLVIKNAENLPIDIGTQSGTNKYGVADNVCITTASNNLNDTQGFHFSSGSVNLNVWKVDIRVYGIVFNFYDTTGNYVIHDGTFVNYAPIVVNFSGTNKGKSRNDTRSIIYWHALEGATLTVKGGQFTFLDTDVSKIDPASTTQVNSTVMQYDQDKKPTTTAVTGCYPFYMTTGAGSINVEGGYVYSGRSYGAFYYTGDNKTAVNVMGGTFIAYRWISISNTQNNTAAFNVYGGTFRNSPGQVNCLGFDVTGIMPINIYGGDFAVCLPGNHATAKAINYTYLAALNVYGGTFTNYSSTATSGIISISVADANVTFHAPGKAYTHPVNGASTTEGVTLVAANAPTLAAFTAKGTVTIEGGTTIKLVGCSALAATSEFANGTGTLTIANSGEGENIKRIKFVLDGTNWIFANEAPWTDFDYEITSLTMNLTEAFTSQMTGNSFEGTFNGGWAEYQSLVVDYFLWQLLEVSGNYGYAHDEDVAGMIGATRVNLAFNITSMGMITVSNGMSVTLNDLDTTFASTLFTVGEGGSLTLNDCSFAAERAGVKNPLVNVTGDNANLTVEGGTYVAGGGYFFQVGTSTKYTEDENTTDVKEGSVLKSCFENTTVSFKDMDVYQCNGSYAFVIYGAKTATFDNVLVSWSKDLNRDSYKTEAELYPAEYVEATNYHAIYTAAKYTKVLNSTLITNSGGSAFTAYGDKLDVINTNVVGYRWAYFYNGTMNVYGGNWYSYPGQANAAGFAINSYGMNGGATMNVYGGNFTILRTHVEAQLANGTQCGIFYNCTTAGIKAGSINIYGGNFKSEQHKSAGLIWIQNASNATVTVYPAGTAYTNYDGQPATATVANFVRDGAGYLVKFGGAGTVVLGSGTNVTLLDGAQMFLAADGATLDATGVNVTIGEGGVLPADEAMWANTSFTMTGAANAAELINGDNYLVTDQATAIAAANAAFLRAYASNTYIKPNVNLTMQLDSIVPFIVGEGASLTLSWADLNYTGTFVTVNGGTVVINDGTFIANNVTSRVLLLQSGSLTINGGSFTRDSYGNLLEVNSGTLTITNGTFTLGNGGIIVYYYKGASTTTVSGGTFTKLIPENNTSSSYSGGGIFYVADSTNETEGTLYINGGTFTATGIVRIYARWTQDATYTADSVAHETKGFKAYISGGSFIGDADEYRDENQRYMFQIARPGAHLIEFTKGGTATVEASGYNQIFMFNASSVVELGATINVYSGVFDGGWIWFGGNKICTINIDGATFKDTKGVTTGEGGFGAIYATNGSKFTIKNSTFSAPAVKDGFWYTNSSKAEITFENCVIDTRLLITADVAAVSSFKNTVIITRGDEGTIFENANTTLDGVTLVNPVVYSNAKPTSSHGKIDAYAPIVMFGGFEYKAWSMNKASGENASVTGAVALYADTAAAETSGIRFSSTVSADVTAALTAGGKTLKFGTLVAPADYVAKAKTFTPEALEAAFGQTTSYVKIPAVYSVVYDGEGNVSFSGILVNLKSNTRVYAAVSYIEVYDGETLVDTVYSAYDAQQNAKSAEQLADAVLVDTEKYATLDAGEKAIIDAYANGKVEVEIPEPAPAE